MIYKVQMQVGRHATDRDPRPGGEFEVNALNADGALEQAKAIAQKRIPEGCILRTIGFAGQGALRVIFTPPPPPVMPVSTTARTID